MKVTVKLRYLRISARKVRLVADLIRGKKIEEAQAILRFTIKKAARPLLKLLKSALASATNNFRMEESNLYVSKILVDEGPKYKRWRARARGQAFEIQKKTSHITIVLEEIKKKAKKVKKVKRAKKIKEVKKEVVEKKKRKEKPRFKAELETKRPRIERGAKRVFRRKAF